MPEFIFRTVIVRGIRLIRNEIRYLDQLFRNLDQESAAAMRDFVRTQKIYIDINYPRETLKLPAIVILLKSSGENQAYLADTMGHGDMPDGMSYDSFEGEDGVLSGAASLSTLSGEGTVVFGPYNVQSATNNTLTIDENLFDRDKFLVGGDHTVHIIGGTAAGEQRRITANGNSTLMVAPNWSRNPASDSVFVVRSPAEEVMGQPSAIFKRETELERIGVLEDVSYQIQVIGPNPELTIYLHAMVKALLLISRMTLERQGIIDMKMGATDFLPKADYVPDMAFMRALNVDFKHPFDLFVEPTDLATQFRIILENTFNSQIEILSDTEV